MQSTVPWNPQEDDPRTQETLPKRKRLQVRVKGRVRVSGLVWMVRVEVMDWVIHEDDEIAHKD